MKTGKVAGILGLCLGLMWSTAGQAQSWPARTISIVHGFEAGAGVDMVTRLLAEELSKSLQQPVIVVAKPGAGGTIGAGFVANAAPDGYTFLVALSSHAIAGAMRQSLRYRPVEDFEWITTVHEFPLLLAVRSDSPLKNLKAAVDAVKAKPESVSYGTSGVGAVSHLIGELLSRSNDARFLHVPFKSDATALMALLGNDIEMVVLSPNAAIPQVKEGKVRILAVTSARRWSVMPEVPTVEEAGLAPMDVSSYFSLAAPAGTPKPILDRLNQDIQAALKQPHVRTRIEGIGSQVVLGGTSEALRQRVADDLIRWQKVVAEAGIVRQ